MVVLILLVENILLMVIRMQAAWIAFVWTHRTLDHSSRLLQADDDVGRLSGRDTHLLTIFLVSGPTSGNRAPPEEPASTELEMQRFKSYFDHTDRAT